MVILSVNKIHCKKSILLIKLCKKSINEISKDMTHTTRTVLDADWLRQNCQLKGTRISDFRKVST